MTRCAIFLFFALSSLAQATDFDLAFSYGQSRDFWQTVQSVQDRTGNISDIQAAVKDRYGKPDLLYSYLDASYARPHELFDGNYFNRVLIGTRAEAVAGGEISNPVSPEIQAYANSTGIASFGFTSSPMLEDHSFFELKSLVGFGTEKRLYAQGAELIDSIPVRSGLLFLGGLEGSFADQSKVGDDFWITSYIMARGVYFHSTVSDPKSRSEDNSFAVFRWRIQNEWLKETETFLAKNTRVGIISVTGQNPQPYLVLPITWDYQQHLSAFPGFESIGGIGGIVRFLNKKSLPNVSFYAGLFGGSVGGGLDLQIGSALLQASSYGVENFLTPSRDKTRIWNLSLGFAL